MLDIIVSILLLEIRLDRRKIFEQTETEGGRKRQ